MTGKETPGGASQSVNDIVDVLFANGVLVELNVGRWTAVKKLYTEDVLMTSTINTKLLYMGNKKLVPPESLYAIQDCESKARVLLASRSSPFPISGARYITTHALPEVQTRLEALRKQFFEEVDKFLAKYPELREKQLKEFELQFDAIATDNLKKSAPEQQANRWAELKEWLDTQKTNSIRMYPNIDVLKGKFYFHWRPFKIAAAEGESFNDHNKELEGELKSWPKEASKEAHKALGERAVMTRMILEKQEGLSAKNLKPLWDAFEDFKALDFTGTSTYLKVIEAIKTTYFKMFNGAVDFQITATMLNDSEVLKKGLADMLTTLGQLSFDNLAEQASKDALLSSEGFKRFVDLS